MTYTPLNISVIICAYTEARWDDLVAAVESVQRQSLPPREIIVVVDYNPNLLERVRMSLRGVVVVENHEQQGLSGARNAGIAVSEGDVIAFLDDDAIAAPDWLACLRMGYDSADVMGVGGAIEPMWLGGQPKWFPDEFNWVVGCTYRGMPKTTASVRNLIGANMSFRREILSVSGFCNGVGQVSTSMLRCDDTEFCIRVGHRWPQKVLRYEPQAKVYHRVPASRACWDYFRSRCYTEGQAKALVSRLVGMRDGLASERTYTFRTLPRGVLRGLVDTVLYGDPAGLMRAGAIVAGLTITTVGYVQGKIVERLEPLRKRHTIRAV
jgi:glycosyltransferase involved in cell wall biosynthesis